MKPEMSIVLITDSSPSGRAKARVLMTLIGSSLTVWPSAGLAVDDRSRFRNAEEFWVAPEAGEGIVLRFDSNSVFRMPRGETWQTWGWYLSRVYPRTPIRFLLRTDTLPAMFTREPIQPAPEQFPFSLSLLQHAFHDMKHLENPRDCRRAAAWLSSLEESVLLPFKFLGREKFWEDWDTKSGPDSNFRKIRVRILDGEETVRKALKKDAIGFWQEVCLRYQTWATGAMSDAERTEVARVVQLWQ